MKRLVSALILTALLAPNAFAGFFNFKRESARAQAVLARVTVYWASGGRGSDKYTRRHQCATGTRLRTGHCAVDPQKIPYGSNIVFPDGSCLAAVDTGSAVKNRKAARLSGRTACERNAPVVDRFFETKQEALRWANSHPLYMAVRVVPPNQRIAALVPGKRQPVRRAIAVGSLARRQRTGLNGQTFASVQLPRVVR